jgi:hypothetical protein
MAHEFEVYARQILHRFSMEQESSQADRGQHAMRTPVDRCARTPAIDAAFADD